MAHLLRRGARALLVAFTLAAALLAAATPASARTAYATALAVSGSHAPGAPVAFNASASTDPDGTVASYRWDFGDGTTTTTATPTASHIYAHAGDYAASVTVADAGGCSTETVFTGQTATCAGSPTARAAATVAIAAPRPPAPPARPAKPAIRALALTPRCVRANRSGRVRVRLAMRLADAGAVRVRIDRAVGARALRKCPPARSGRRFTGRLRNVATIERTRARSGAVWTKRRASFQRRLAPGLYRLVVRARGAEGALSRPAVRFLRVLGR